MGANEVIYLSNGDPVKTIQHLTKGLGADIGIECVGHRETPQLVVNLVRKKGTAVVVGLFLEQSSFHFASVNFNEITVVGSSYYVHEAKTAITLMSDGRIDPSRLITSKVPLRNAVEMGFEELIRNKEENIKILLEIS